MTDLRVSKTETQGEMKLRGTEKPKVLGDNTGSFIVVLKRLPKIGKNLLLPAG